MNGRKNEHYQCSFKGGIIMQEYMKVFIDESKGIVLLGYDSIAYEDEVLEDIREGFKKAYGYEVLMLPNATVSIV